MKFGSNKLRDETLHPTGWRPFLASNNLPFLFSPLLQAQFNALEFRLQQAPRPLPGEASPPSPPFPSHSLPSLTPRKQATPCVRFDLCVNADVG